MIYFMYVCKNIFMLQNITVFDHFVEINICPEDPNVTL